MKPPETSAPDTRVTIHDGLTRQTATTFKLVLLSAGVKAHLVQSGALWQIRVPIDAQRVATASIAAYLSENENLSPIAPSWPVFRTWAGVGMALVILAVHLAVSYGGQVFDFRRIYDASATNILNGELYRITTALFLHVNSLHLIGNMTGLALFSTAVCSVAGFGVGSLMILISGMTGNLFNALLFQSGHHSIGASTAVFGAVGIISAHLFSVKWQQFGHRLNTWLPLGSGLALLAILGASIETDITAHFFGYVSGCMIGLAFTSTRESSPGRKTQYICLLAAVTLVMASFLCTDFH
jgi:membrane associated rhomboid family serine protease